MISYGATAVDDCLGGAPASPVGSWTVTLTSVEPYSDATNPNGPHFIVHGSVTGTVLMNWYAADAGSDTATIALHF